MPLKLTAPLEQEFTLEQSDEMFGTDGEPTRITVRQATQAQNEKRSAVYSEVTQVIQGIDDNELKLRQRWTMEELKRQEVFLTMVSCNILDESGNNLFRFKNVGNRQVLDMSDRDFAVAWGKLHPVIAEEIHQKVLLVNMTWAGPLGK